MAKFVFLIVAALICIKMVCGTFFALGNMDNHFLHIFSNLETLIRSISPGGAGGPLLSTRLWQKCRAVCVSLKLVLFLFDYSILILQVHSFSLSLLPVISNPDATLVTISVSARCVVNIAEGLFTDHECNKDRSLYFIECVNGSI